MPIEINFFFTEDEDEVKKETKNLKGEYQVELLVTCASHTVSTIHT